MERLTLSADLIARAAKGEADAAEDLLDRVYTGKPEEQLAVLRALHSADSAAFWQRMLEFLGHGTWNGIALGKIRRTELETRVRALFVVRTDGDRGDLAREEAILHGIQGTDQQVYDVAVGMAGESGNHGFVGELMGAVRSGDRYGRIHAIRALGQIADAKAVPALLEALHSRDELIAGLAKDALAQIGHPAVGALQRIFEDHSESEQVRWMAGRALGQIADVQAVPALVAELNNESYAMRWVSADALVAIKGPALRATLEVVATRPLWSGMADAAAHVLHCLQRPETKEILKPVVDALRSVDAVWAAPEAAEAALNRLESKGLV